MERDFDALKWIVIGLTVALLWAVGSSLAHAQECTELVAVGPQGESLPFTLDHTDVQGELVGGFASVVITQIYLNPYDYPLEAEYRFPLPHDAAVDRMALIVGDRFIEAEVRERSEAREIYEEARDEGRHTALLEQERPNVFSQRIANILPGEQVMVTLHYVAQLRYQEGEYLFELPTVVGSRYVPAEVSAEPGMLSLRVPYATNAANGKNQLSLSLNVRPGVPLFGIHSVTHAIDVDLVSDREAIVSLPDGENLPDRDVVIAYRVASQRPAAGLVAHRSGTSGTFVLAIEPEVSPTERSVTPRELVFVVDTSGSMMGEPMKKARAAIVKALKALGPDDTFSVINFSSQASSLSPTPLTNTPQNVAQALEYVQNLAGAGGTEMLSGIRAALSGRPERGRMRVVVFLTDGYIGNDQAVINFVEQNIGETRLFSFGVGDSVNRYLLDQLARAGRGAVEYVTLTEDTDQVVGRFYARIGQPYLTDISIDWGSLKVEEVSPARTPDLFLGQPLRVFGRYTRPGRSKVLIHGKMAGEDVVIALMVELPEHRDEDAIVETLWARQRIAALLGEYERSGREELEAEVLELGLQYHLMTPFTSMVAVERKIVANAEPDLLRTALASVHLPAGLDAKDLFATDAVSGALYPSRIKPGDPEILVHAPASARRVVAVLPWGEQLECSYQEVHQAWMTRFLVPREAQEGLYRIRIFIEDESGQMDHFTLFYRVDSTAPKMRLEVEEADGALALNAIPIANVYEGKALGTVGGVVVRVRADVKRVVARVGGQVFVLEPIASGAAWRAEVPAGQLRPGRHEVELIVTDFAGNVSSEQTEVTVQ